MSQPDELPRTDYLEFEQGQLVKISGMRPEYMDGYRLIAMTRALAQGYMPAPDFTGKLPFPSENPFQGLLTLLQRPDVKAGREGFNTGYTRPPKGLDPLAKMEWEFGYNLENVLCFRDHVEGPHERGEPK